MSEIDLSTLPPGVLQAAIAGSKVTLTDYGPVYERAPVTLIFRKPRRFRRKPRQRAHMLAKRRRT